MRYILSAFHIFVHICIPSLSLSLSLSLLLSLSLILCYSIVVDMHLSC